MANDFKNIFKVKFLANIRNLLVIVSHYFLLSNL